MSRPTPEFQIEFLAYVQRIFDEGEFVATYKFALLMALADLSVEQGEDTDSTLSIRAKDIARMFLKYYDRQVLPFVGHQGEIGELLQNTGQQAAVVNRVREAHAHFEFQGPAGLTRLVSVPGLLSRISQTVKVQPLWKLQTLAGERVPFLYGNLDSGDVIELNPGVAFCFRRFHGLVYRMAQDAWIRFVRERPYNQQLMGDTIDLASFLFGQERADLSVYQPLLVDLQSRRCFYCNDDLNNRPREVDHFIPWSRYSFDLGHNFVIACKPCNGQKRDFLAGTSYLENWSRRNEDHANQMKEFFVENELPSDLEGSVRIARWAYGQAETASAQVWIGNGHFAHLTPDWRTYL